MKVAIITGASTGIGAALARELGKRGWAVGLVARRLDLLEQIAAEIRAAGGSAAAATADVTARDQVEAAVTALEAALGPCDLLVANAGAGGPASANKVPIEAAISQMRLNYEGVVYATGAVLPGMLERRSGHLAVVSSLAAHRGVPGSGPYCASKAAVSTLYESFRLDLAGTGIAVTTIHPGFVTTPLTERLRQPMPFVMSAERAAVIIADGLERRRLDISFPWQTATLMNVMRVVPAPLWAWLIRGRAP